MEPPSRVSGRAFQSIIHSIQGPGVEDLATGTRTGHFLNLQNVADNDTKRAMLSERSLQAKKKLKYREEKKTPTVSYTSQGVSTFHAENEDGKYARRS